MLAGNKKNWRLVGVKLHLTGNPPTIKVSEPPALLLELLTLARADKGDAEVALRTVGPRLLLRRRGSYTERERETETEIMGISKTQHERGEKEKT